MEQDEFTLEYFCRLCAAEAALGVMLHPLFPPGDDDPKDELVRMIDVLTSVTLNRTQDSAAVICDKCLQMLDLFCQFREECLRQDVMIRTRRELDKERRQEEAAAAAVAAAAVCVEIKEEPDEPPTIVIDDCKDEPPEEEEEEEEDDDEDDEDREVQPCANQMAQQLLASSLVTNNSSSNSSSSFVTPAEISLYSQTSSLSISVQVNQISLDNMGTAALVAVPVIAPVPDQNQLPPAPPPTTSSSTSTSSSAAATFRKGKLDPNKPPPDCELCQESFATHYDYEQHLDQVHAWDRGTRCSLACDPCQMRFTKSYNLKRHMYEVHGELAPGLTVTACEYCGLKFLRGYTLNRHVAKMHSKRAKAKKMMILKSK